MCGDRFIVQAAVTTRVDQPRKQLRIVAVTRRFAQQAYDGLWRLPDVGFERCVELVRHRQARIERQRALECLLRIAFAVNGALDVLANHAVAPTEVSPRQCETRIQFERAQIEITSL